MELSPPVSKTSTYGRIGFPPPPSESFLFLHYGLPLANYKEPQRYSWDFLSVLLKPQTDGSMTTTSKDIQIRIMVLFFVLSKSDRREPHGILPMRNQERMKIEAIASTLSAS